MDKLDIEQIDESFDKDEYISKLIKGKNISVEFTFPSNFNSAKILRDFVSIISTHLGLSRDFIPKLILVVDELNNNSIEYGSQIGEINKMRFISKNLGNTIDINVEVEDSGNGKNPKSAFEMEQIKSQKLLRGFDNYSSIRGRGLFMIIFKIVDDLYFNDSSNNGLIVGIRKHINYS